MTRVNQIRVCSCSISSRLEPSVVALDKQEVECAEYKGPHSLSGSSHSSIAQAKFPLWGYPKSPLAIEEFADKLVN